MIFCIYIDFLLVLNTHAFWDLFEAKEEPTSSSASKDINDPKEAITALSQKIQQLGEDINYYYTLLAKLANGIPGVKGDFAESEIEKLIEDTK